VKLKHWVAVSFIIIGAAFVLHLVMSHGGVRGFKSGVGLA
jgi:hypothetical protein